MTYTVVITKINGDILNEYQDQEESDVNSIIEKSLSKGYPLPFFDGNTYELNEFEDVSITEDNCEECEACHGCGYDAVIDSVLSE